jgi:acetoacetate decarboxylase
MNKNGKRVLAAIVLPLLIGGARADDWALARAASCDELIAAYKETVAAEKKVAAALKSSKDGTIAANVLGVVSLATFGFGFFHWNNDHSAEENLADIRNDLRIIRTVSAEKKCDLPPS